MLQLRFSPNHNTLDHPNHCQPELEKAKDFLQTAYIIIGNRQKQGFCHTD
jgi:hypothetical protein